MGVFFAKRINTFFLKQACFFCESPEEMSVKISVSLSQIRAIQGVHKNGPLVVVPGLDKKFL
jgi:hypothetical protein